MKNLIGILAILYISLTFSCQKDDNNNKTVQNAPPTAIFSINPHSGSTSTIFEFDGSSSYDNKDPISNLQVRWDFDGDNSWDTDWYYDKTKDYQYSLEGIYSVKMEIKDIEGLTDFVTNDVTVEYSGGGAGPCPGTPTVTDADGNVYNTILIGEQCWMKENLKVGIMIPGHKEMQDNGIIEKYCYEDNEANCNIYGGLYRWEEMMDYSTIEGAKGICPSGWHLPIDDEWCILTTYIDPTVNCNEIGWSGTDIGYNLKSTNGWYSNGNGSDAHGFMVLPGGYIEESGHFSAIVETANFWSSTKLNNFIPYWSLFYSSDGIARYEIRKAGFSVRCLKD